MTLADFARSIGISPALARQWKRRGKIVECDGEFGLSDKAAESLVDGGEYLSDESGVTVVSLTASATASRTVTADDWPYEPLPLVTDCPECHGARWACGHTPIEKLTQIELLTRDNRILSQAVDSLRDLTTEQGMSISQALRRIEALENQNIEQQECIERLNIAIVKDRQRIRTIENGPIDSPGPNWGA